MLAERKVCPRRDIPETFPEATGSSCSVSLLQPFQQILQQHDMVFLILDDSGGRIGQRRHDRPYPGHAAGIDSRKTCALFHLEETLSDITERFTINILRFSVSVPSFGLFPYFLHHFSETAK